MKPLKAVLVGCGGMGLHQLEILNELEEFNLTAASDIDSKKGEKIQKQFNIKFYSDYKEMLLKEKPDVVSICTPNSLHAEQTITAVEMGIKGIYCEKPMAVNLEEAEKMVNVCKEKGVHLVIGHQRRLGEDLKKIKELMDNGILGDVRLIRAQCAGDILSDGTHAIDSILWLNNDIESEWVVGQVHREIPSDDKFTGFRYGHIIEKGGMAILRLKNNIRIELYCGDLREDYSPYQDYKIIGSKGIAWRTGDMTNPNLFILDNKKGNWIPGLDEWMYKPILSEKRNEGLWRPIDIEKKSGHDLIKTAYKLFYQSIVEGRYHPMNAENALKGFEIIMAIYESARLHKKIYFPLQQTEFPLDLMYK